MIRRSINAAKSPLKFKKVYGLGCALIIITMLFYLLREQTEVKYPTNTYQVLKIDTIQGTANIGDFKMRIAYWEQKHDSTIYYVHGYYMSTYLCTVRCGCAFMASLQSINAYEWEILTE